MINTDGKDHCQIDVGMLCTGGLGCTEQRGMIVTNKHETDRESSRTPRKMRIYAATVARIHLLKAEGHF